MYEYKEINKYLEVENIISEDVSIFNDCVKDYESKDKINSEIKAYICNKTKVIFLKRNKIKDYYIKPCNFWNNNFKLTNDNITKAEKYSSYDLNRRIKYIEKYIDNKIYVDFGTGFGSILKEKLTCKKKYGIEIFDNIVKHLKSEKIEVFNNIEDVKEEIDVITLFHVLEHLEKPIEILKSVYKKMKDDGILIIEVPHAGDFMLHDLKNQKYKNFILWEEHLVLHNKYSIEKLLNICGFKMISIEYIQRYSLSNHLYWCNDGLPNGHNILKILNNNSLEKEYEKTLAGLEKTDTIICLFKKNN